MSTMAKLKQAVAGLACPADIEDDAPVWDEGCITVQLDHAHKREFMHGATCACAPYWRSEKGSRARAIASLIEDVESGTTAMSEETAYACGIDL